MRARGVVLGVDVGTTATKVVSVDATGAISLSVRREHPLSGTNPGEAVQDPATVLQAAVGAIREAAQQCLAAGQQVDGMALGTAMHSLMAVDDAEQPLTPLITWADERATEQAERLRTTDQGRALHRRTGTPIHAMSPLAKLVWFREHAPEVLGQARRWLGMKQYLVAHLTGEHVVDMSVASGTGLFDLRRETWDPEALALAGLDASQLAQPVPTTTVLPLRLKVAVSLGLPAATTVVVGAGDGPLANLGVGAIKPGLAACSIGTSGAVRVAVDAPGIDEQGRLFCYALAPGRWVVGGATNSGGIVLEWLAQQLSGASDGSEADLLEAAAAVPPGSCGLLMLPYLFGERAPRWGGPARGAYIGLTHAHGKGHLTRAALEGVCLQLSLVLDAIREADAPVREVRATGGFAQSPFWRQLLTDVLALPVSFPATPEGSAVGAALLGLYARGELHDLDQASDLIKVEEIHQPQPGAAGVYENLRPLFASLYDTLADANRALDALDR